MKLLRTAVLIFTLLAGTPALWAVSDINIVFIGNSITAGATLKNAAEQAPPVVCGQMVQKMTGIPVHVFNGGHSGITTFGFLPGRADFEKVCRAATDMVAQNGGVLYFSIMLGTNDSASTKTEGAPVSPDTYEENMTRIVEELIKRFPSCKIIVNYPIWYSPNTHNSACYLQEGLDRLHSYYPIISRLAKSHEQVYDGNSQTWQFFENNLSLFTPENGREGVFYLHPNADGASALARFWAESIVKLCCKDGIKESANNDNKTFSQGGVIGFIRKVGSLIDTLSVRGVDRNYIDAPERPWQFIVRGNVNQSSLKMHTAGSIAGVDYNATPYLKTEPSRYVGLWAGYRGYGLGYTVNVGGDKGSYLTFGATGGAYGLNLRIHSFKNNHPYFNLSSNLIPEENKDDWDEIQLIDPIKVRTVIADGYYLFNGKRFSYAAAYDQSVLQKRSAGSLMAGAMYYYGNIDYASNTNGDLIYLMRGLGKVELWQGSVGLGYAYNWVPTQGLLVSAMAMPMLTFVNKIKAYGYNTNVSELMLDVMFLDEDVDNETWDDWFYSNLRITPMGDKTFSSGVTVNFDARLSLTYNFGRYFVNAYGQFNNFRYRHSDSHGHLNDWFVNTSFGIRL